MEAENNELKHRHGYGIASSSGISAMEMQRALSIFIDGWSLVISFLS